MKEIKKRNTLQYTIDQVNQGFKKAVVQIGKAAPMLNELTKKLNSAFKKLNIKKEDEKLFRDDYCNICGWDVRCKTCGTCCNCGYSDSDCCDEPNEKAMEIFKGINRAIGR